MKAIFVVVLLCVSSYVVEGLSPIKNLQAHTQKDQHLGPASNPQKRTAAPPAAPLPTQDDAPRFAAHHAEAGGTAGSSSSTGGDDKMTPGPLCSTFSTCLSCTGPDSLVFYCAWSPARNVCSSEPVGVDVESLRESDPTGQWTKHCGPITPEPITDCQGCPILAADHKPHRDIIESVIKGSDGQFIIATEGRFTGIIGSNPHDPLTAPILFPNGTNGQQFVFPSIQNDDGTIKDPIVPDNTLIHPACTGQIVCTIEGSSFKQVKTGKKIQAVEVGSDADKADDENDDSANSGSKLQFKQHVDKVEMQYAQLENDPGEDATSQIEISSTVKKIDGEGFTPTFSDDDSAPVSASADVTPASSASTSDDVPRFKQNKRSVSHAMSSSKAASNSADNTIEVTEFDDNVVGGRKINEDEISSKQEADVQQ